MRTRKNNLKKNEFVSSVKFCTECGAVLEDYSLKKTSKDEISALERFHNCRKSGKFKGEFCSRLFIAENNIDEFPEQELSAEEDIENPNPPDEL